VLVTLLLVGIVYGQSDIATLTLLTDAATKQGAVCLDGSPSAYYFRPGFGDGVTKYFIHHEGGGWCSSPQDCYGRSHTALGSSKGYATTKGLGGGYFSNKATENPLMYNWNMVYLQYCDGGSFAGDNEIPAVVSGQNVYFRGFRNLVAYLEDLVTKHNLLKGTDVVIGGCSASGLATFLHVDWWQQHVSTSSKVRGLPDSGFFLDYDTVQKYSTTMKWVFNAMNASNGVNQACLLAHTPTKDRELCYFAEHTSPHLTTPIFPLQSQYDSWQTQFILGSADAGAINAYGQMFETRFKANVLSNGNNGAFLDSCYHHCGEWNSITIDGMNSGAAFLAWYNGQKGVHLQGKAYPCDACCKPANTTFQNKL